MNRSVPFPAFEIDGWLDARLAVAFQLMIAR